MCKCGDIILVDSYKDNNAILSHHSFIVIDDSGGEISGLPYDIISVVMSSVKNRNQSARKFNYPGNLPIGSTEQTITDPPGGNGKNGFIKCEQFYYFNKSSTKFTVIGSVNEGVLDIIYDYINELIDNKIVFKHITDNL